MPRMGDAARQTLVSERDYLAGERESDMRHEQAPPSVVDYLILSQDAPVLERFERDGEGWTRAEFGLGERVELAALGLSLPMDELYEDVFRPA